MQTAGAWGAVPAITYYQQLTLSAALPLVLLALSLPYPIAILLRIRRNMDDTTETRHALRHKLSLYKKMLLWCFFLVFPALTRQLLSFFHCLEVDDVSYLASDFRQECYNDEWSKVLPLIASFAVFYLLLCPGCLFAYLFRHRRQLGSEHVHMSFGFLYRVH